MNQSLAESSSTKATQGQGCDHWLREFRGSRVPVLAQTRERLRELRSQKRDTIPRLCTEISRDAGFTLNLIEHTNRVLKERNQPAVQSLNHAALLLGIPYLHTLNSELEDLEDYPDESVRHALLRQYQQNYHAMVQVRVWLARTQRVNQDELGLCAMLQSAETIRLWLLAPQQAKQLDSLSTQDSEAELQIIGCSLNDLAFAYAQDAYFPSMYLDSTSTEPETVGQCLRLARLISRQADRDWNADIIPQLAQELADLNNWEQAETLAMIHRTAARAAREFILPGLLPAAARLVEIPQKIVLKKQKDTLPAAGEALPVAEVVEVVAPAVEETHPAAVEDAPIAESPVAVEVTETAPIPVKKSIFNKDAYQACAQKLKAVAEGQTLSAHEVISTGMEALVQGLRLQRVTFVMMNRSRDAMASKYIECATDAPALSTLTIDLKEKHLFTRLMAASQCIWMHDENRAKYTPLLPAIFNSQLAANSFLAMSVFIGDKPIGMFYADNEGSDIKLTEKHQKYFKQICSLVSNALVLQGKK